MLPDYDTIVSRLKNYERVLYGVIVDSKQALLDISLILSFLRVCSKIDLNRQSFDELLRSELQIDSRRFWRLINGNCLLTHTERANLYFFIKAKSTDA